jgi:hypothetical protein
MLRSVRAAVAVLIVGLSSTVPAVEAAEVAKSRERVPISGSIYLPCAGETVTLSGTLHVVFHVVEDDRGDFRAHYHFNPQGVSGVGETSGARYQGTGVTRGSFSFKPGRGSSGQLVNNFHIVGSAGNFLVRQRLHVKASADGDVRVTSDALTVTCK